MLSAPSSLRARAGESLRQTQRPGRVILIHTGAMLLLSLILTVADFLLNQQISATGGLDGMGLRSILTTIRSTLQLSQLIILPFWQIGYTYYTLKVARGENAGLSDLLEGFRRWAPVLRLKILVLIMGILLAVISGYAASILFAMTPWATPLITLVSDEGMTEEALLEALPAISQEIMVPILVIFGLCFLAGFVYLFFRFRLAELWLMAHPEGGALAALHNSRLAMRGNCKAMFRIDLHFWWFYILELLVTALCFGDTVLNALGMEMTTDAFWHYLIFFCLYIWAQMSLYWWKRNEVCVTYAHAYLELCTDPVETDDKEKDPVL